MFSLLVIVCRLALIHAGPGGSETDGTDVTEAGRISQNASREQAGTGCDDSPSAFAEWVAASSYTFPREGLTCAVAKTAIDFCDREPDAAQLLCRRTCGRCPVRIGFFAIAEPAVWCKHNRFVEQVTRQDIEWVPVSSSGEALTMIENKHWIFRSPARQVS